MPPGTGPEIDPRPPPRRGRPPRRGPPRGGEGGCSRFFRKSSFFSKKSATSSFSSSRKNLLHPPSLPRGARGARCVGTDLALDWAFQPYGKSRRKLFVSCTCCRRCRCRCRCRWRRKVPYKLHCSQPWGRRPGGRHVNQPASQPSDRRPGASAARRAAMYARTKSQRYAQPKPASYKPVLNLT